MTAIVSSASQWHPRDRYRRVMSSLELPSCAVREYAVISVSRVLPKITRPSALYTSVPERYPTVSTLQGSRRHSQKLLLLRGRNQRQHLQRSDRVERPASSIGSTLPEQMVLLELNSLRVMNLYFRLLIHPNYGTPSES
jgi:hypothetical protein